MTLLTETVRSSRHGSPAARHAPVMAALLWAGVPLHVPTQPTTTSAVLPGRFDFSEPDESIVHDRSGSVLPLNLLDCDPTIGTWSVKPIRLQGDCDCQGLHDFRWDDSGRQNASGDQDCSHERWHKSDENSQKQPPRGHVHLKIRKLAWLLNRLGGTDAQDASGGSVPKYYLITITAKSTDGRSNRSRGNCRKWSMRSVERTVDADRAGFWMSLPTGRCAAVHC